MNSHCNFGKATRGFTMVELMIVVAIIALLAAIAVPQYGQYMRRAEISEALGALTTYRVRMEQFFQNNRSYVAPGGAAGDPCGVLPAAAVPNMRFFTLTCVAEATNPADGTAAAGNTLAYRIVATGNANSRSPNVEYITNELDGRFTRNFPNPNAPPATINRRCWLVGGNECPV